MGGGNHRQRKSSSSSGFFCFSIFKSKKQRGGRYYVYDDEIDDGIKAQKVWPSDEDRGRCGVADPFINIKVKAFIASEIQKQFTKFNLICEVYKFFNSFNVKNTTGK
ncbi:uncharacterized protein G2W53_023482 [Senna tora]|uniref:Uncharacterized protein n=1 Tax=Senna tora TaxID=362788 RepID=A0A834TBW7_9FABA|nr:uncharacterized protein G2W53_023482 [Senna tora]